MKKSPRRSICALLLLCAASSLAVQDPQTSMALLDTKLSTLGHEIAQIDKTLAQTSRSSTERSVLKKKRATLQTERASLIQSREIGKAVRDNPLVKYGDENGNTNHAAQVDKLFEK
ncbi:hypothetical protein EON83_30445 [bacterium]|nr:MAG: hypothetical protein EON83_30445 [bacterium]